MFRRLAAVWGFVALVVAGSVLASASCGTFPDEECRADKSNALTEPRFVEAGLGAADCTSCLQKRCCDLVGRCNEGDGTCTSQMRAMQGCVIDRPTEEAACKAALTSQASIDLYACERARCSTECRVPSCNINAAVNVLVNPTCDRCAAGACCNQINECYENRQCKLFLDCISTHCPNTFGASVTNAGLAPRELLDEAHTAVCDGGAPADRVRASPCFVRCLNEFAPLEGATVDDRQARCSAFGAFTCVAKANCGPKCMLEGGVVTEGVYPEDLDAGPR